jgi:capsule polysaccharide modification protein KpsS
LLTFGLPPNVVTPAIKGVEDASSIGIVFYLFILLLSTAYNHTIDHTLLDLILVDKWFDISSCKDAVDSS